MEKQKLSGAKTWHGAQREWELTGAETWHATGRVQEPTGAKLKERLIGSWSSQEQRPDMVFRGSRSSWDLRSNTMVKRSRSSQGTGLEASPRRGER